MWPGQQPPGGEQNPQDQNPYQQPGYRQQPNPYQQPGYGQPGPSQPNPYQQPAPAGPPMGAPAQTAPQWTGPAGPGGPQPPKDRSRRTTIIAITAAVAVVAAAVITGVVVMKDDGKETVAKKDPTSAPSLAPSSPAPSSGSTDAPVDNPRGGGDDVKPVVDGWKVVVSSKRHIAYDVPAEWSVDSPGMSVGFSDDKGKPLITMSSPAYYKQGVCGKNTQSAAVGTKGAQGAKSEESAAKIEAENWLIAGYDQKQTGKLDSTDAKPFKSDHGLTGYSSSATVTGVTKTEKCSSDGKSFTVTYKDTNGDLATWVLYADKGVDGELPDDTVKKIMSSLRPLKSS
ncbi:hypothetical protein [Streptomyces olivoreticuli]|uniref:hypothetical protein n=1 Tax=Streptomyces olivoreticuli TaxID=68246 RepID=UPI000E27F63A|nr:hypothetical protein [Streptomyces olivoreticuli]